MRWKRTQRSEQRTLNFSHPGPIWDACTDPNCIPAAARHDSRPLAGSIQRAGLGPGHNKARSPKGGLRTHQPRGNPPHRLAPPWSSSNVSRPKRASHFGRAVEEPSGVALQQAAELVDRYPNLSEIELVRLINLYRELSALEVALLISEDELAPKLGRFVKDHRSKVRTPFRQYAVLVAIAAAGIALFIWVLLFAA